MSYYSGFHFGVSTVKISFPSIHQSHDRIHKFCQMGPNFDNVLFLVDDGREDPNTTLRGPSPMIAEH